MISKREICSFLLFVSLNRLNSQKVSVPQAEENVQLIRPCKMDFVGGPLTYFNWDRVSTMVNGMKRDSGVCSVTCFFFCLVEATSKLLYVLT